ncbi:hypothetical protein GF327_08720 [Candidatus Woesearchaeota archaeon]|nr:hypothetical protein [Candidatus Woesearchaeota archaeon]
MKEDEYRRRGLEPHEKKSMSKKTFSILVIMFLTAFILSLIFEIRIFIFLTLTALTGVINYNINLLTFRVDPGLEVFLSLVLTRTYGLGYGLVLIFAGEIIPDLLTARLDKDTTLSIIFTLLINFVAVQYPDVNFVLLGLILVTIKFIICLGLDIIFMFAPEEMIFETGLNFVVNIILLLAFGDIFIALLG